MGSDFHPPDCPGRWRMSIRALSLGLLIGALLGASLMARYGPERTVNVPVDARPAAPSWLREALDRPRRGTAAWYAIVTLDYPVLGGLVMRHKTYEYAAKSHDEARAKMEETQRLFQAHPPKTAKTEFFVLSRAARDNLMGAS